MRARELDVVFDTVGGATLERFWGLLKKGGRLVTVAAQSESLADQRSREAFLLVRADGTQLAEIGKLIDARLLRVCVAQTFPLDAARSGLCPGGPGRIAREGRASRGRLGNSAESCEETIVINQTKPNDRPVMRTSCDSMQRLSLTLAVMAMSTGVVGAHDAEVGVAVKPVRRERLAHVPGQTLTAVTVNYEPGGKSSEHQHAGSVFASVLQGAVRSENFLIEDLVRRLAGQPVEFRLLAQIPQPGDATSDASVVWPEDRRTVELGTLRVAAVVDHQGAVQSELAFDPINLTEGIELSDDPLPALRSKVYGMAAAHRQKRAIVGPDSATR